MSASFKKERALVRKRLQHHRQQLLQQFGDNKALSRPTPQGHLFEPDGTFPRSITMRLLTNRQNFVLLAVAELFPLLVRHFLKSSLRPNPQSNEEE
jgi:hypothetical protein